MITLPSIEQADAQAADAAELPGAAEVLDAATLSQRLQRHVQITHVRIKPGHSVVVAHTDLAGEHGWTMLTVDADKFGKAQQRAAEFDEPIQIHRTDAPFLCSGTVWSDPALAKELADARGALTRQYPNQEIPWKVLRYNPRRRLVAVVGAGKHEKVVRVAAGGAEHLLSVAGRWRDLGIPVTGVQPLGHRQSATIAPLWGVGDLVTRPYPPAARSAGQAIGLLHRAPGAENCGTPIAANPMAAAEGLGIFAPWLSGHAEDIAARLEERLLPSRESAVSQIHGDLSPDQVILAAEESHKIRIIDLDRAGYGHPMRDIASWVASCRRLGEPDLIDAFLAGYAAQAWLEPEDLDAWEAYAHLAASADFFRHRDPDWPARTVETLNLAEEALRR